VKAASRLPSMPLTAESNKIVSWESSFLGPARARISLESPATTKLCPKCGSHHIRLSQPRGIDVVLASVLRRFRCVQCSRRFYGFRYHWIRRAAVVTLCLIVMLMLATWFAVLHALQKDRALAAPEQVQPAATTPARLSVDEILKNQQPHNAP
jgi:hypothetical protein